MRICIVELKCQRVAIDELKEQRVASDELKDGGGVEPNVGSQRQLEKVVGNKNIFKKKLED